MSKTRKESKPRQANQKRELSNYVRSQKVMKNNEAQPSSLIFVKKDQSSKTMSGGLKKGSSIERFSDQMNAGSESRNSILNERQAKKMASKLT